MLNLKKIIVMVFLTLLLAIPMTAWAEDHPVTIQDEYQPYKLGEVVVSADNPAVPSIGITGSVTAEDIEQTHSLTVPEALTYTPGVTVTTGRKNEPEIRIHGFDQWESLILIDGVPYYETNYGKLNLNQLPTGMIARIDVVKDAPSVLYGPNALAGVINIVTKQATDRPTFDATGEVGEDGAYHLAASHGNSVGKFKYWINADRYERSAWELSSDYKPKTTTVTNRPGGTTQEVVQGDGKRANSWLRRSSLWAKVGMELASESQYFLSGYFIDSSWGFPPSTDSERVINFRPAFSTFASMTKYEDWGLDLSGEQRITQSFKMRGKMFYHNHVDDYTSYSDATYSKAIAVSRYQDYFAGGALFADWDIFDQDVLKFAMHYRGDSHKERDDNYLPLAESFSYTGSLAVENEWTPINGLALVAGISYDWFNVTEAQKTVTNDNGDYVRTDDDDTGDTKNSINPMVGASYTFGNATRLFGSVAKKTRFPTLSQLFSNRNGNADLEAEESINYTLGVARPFGNNIQTKMAIFYHDVSNRISRDGPNLDDQYRNYADVKLYGVEVGGEYKPLKRLTLRADYTYLESKDESPGRVTDNVVGAPKHKVDFRVVYQVPAVETKLIFQGLWLASQFDQLATPANPTQKTLETSGYFLANINVIQPLWDHYEVFGYVKNLFDRDYESEAGYPAPGRAFWVGIRARF